MVERLLERLGSRFVFVVGKGGVGKTTAAGALALALAERGERVHLLSTDPAHSVGDLFGAPLPAGRAVPSPCGDALVLEELDAEARWATWRDQARGPLVDLLDRGTYLDRDDIEAFLDLSLPGVDEVAALLRLTDLEAGSSARVVVDTAPTGHTLRLLRTAGLVRGWADAFEAVDAKARAVAEGLVHRSVRFPSEAVVDDLRERARRFEDAVVRRGDAVVVEGGEDVVAAESGRLRDALGGIGLRVAARLRVGGDSAAGSADGGDVLTVPWHRELTGCDGLRRWGTGGAAPARPPAGAAPRGEAADERTIHVLGGLPRDLVLFVGKGGVGKSTCAAACAVALAGERSVELLGVDPAGSLSDVLDAPVDAEGVQIASRLRARELDAERAFREFKDRYRDEVEEAFRRVGLDRSATLDRRVVESLLDLAPPGVDELLAVASLLDRSEEGATRVVDTAPTGHLLRLLETPERTLGWVRQLMRVLVKYRAGLGLDELAERLLDLAKRLKSLHLRLRDPESSGAVVVTLSGPLDQPESERLVRRLHALGLPVAAVIRNRWDGGEPPDPDAGAPVLRAPVLAPPPVGPQALARFLATWSAP